MQQVPLLLLALTPMLVNEAPLVPPKKIDAEMKLNWKSQIGCASFKTNVTFNGQEIIIGSNGENFHDYIPIDLKSGVYRINAKNGKIINRVGQGDFGDMDVNGTLLLNNKIYFGNDNEEFLCTSMDGKIQWSLATSGDIEHEPVIIRHRSINQIIYATEMGEVRAVDPDNGTTLWTYYLPDFKGWKPGKNRTAFKVGAYFSSTQSFYTKPELVDLNKDGTLDLVYQLYNHEMVALDGSNGHLLWSKKIDNSEIFTTQIGDSKNPIFITTSLDFSDYYAAQGYLYVLDRNGEIKRTIKKRVSADLHCINSMKINKDESIIGLSDSLYIFTTDGNIKKTFDYGALLKKYDTTRRGRYYGDAVLGKNAFTYKGNKNCVIMMRQYPGEKYEASIDIISIDDEKIIDRFSLNNRSEMPPVVADVNKDGKLDLLVNSFDGYLYCYTLPNQ